MIIGEDCSCLEYKIVYPSFEEAEKDFASCYFKAFHYLREKQEIGIYGLKVDILARDEDSFWYVIYRLESKKA